MENQDDREFAGIIAAVANLRKVDRSTAINVTPLFQPLTDRLSPVELKDYILSRYQSKRGEEHSGKYDVVDIGEQELKSFDSAFLYKDFLRIIFGYGDSWKTVNRFQAVLLNDQL